MYSGTPTDVRPLASTTRYSLGEVTQRVINHIHEEFRNDRYRPGARLPSERKVASDLKVSRNTVTAAYDSLEQCGLIRRIQGKGAFRCNPQISGEGFSWSGKISSNAHLLDEPVLEVLARRSDVPYGMSAGTPCMECFPTAIYREAADKVINSHGRAAFTVAPTEGQDRLRHSLASWQGVEPKHLLVTAGGQEAIDLVARCLIEPGDCAIVESPTYPGAIQCLRAAGARLIPWHTKWSLEELETLLLRYRPKLLFTTPTFQNPTGRVMPLAVRQGLLDLAGRYHLPIIEDGVYTETYLSARPTVPSLFKLDKRAQVMYISTFSKTLAPGIRVGWVIAPPFMVKQLALMKMRANLFTGGLNQLIMSDLLESGAFDRHLEGLRKNHRSLRDCAVSLLQPAVTEGLLSFSVPQGGLYLWCNLARGIDMEEVLAAAEAKGVSVACGDAFFSDQPARSFFRICYTAVRGAQLPAGITKLATAIRETAKCSIHLPAYPIQ